MHRKGICVVADCLGALVPSHHCWGIPSYCYYAHTAIFMSWWCCCCHHHPFMVVSCGVHCQCACLFPIIPSLPPVSIPLLWSYHCVERSCHWCCLGWWFVHHHCPYCLSVMCIKPWCSWLSSWGWSLPIILLSSPSPLLLLLLLLLLLVCLFPPLAMLFPISLWAVLTAAAGHCRPVLLSVIHPTNSSKQQPLALCVAPSHSHCAPHFHPAAVQSAVSCFISWGSCNMAGGAYLVVIPLPWAPWYLLCTPTSNLQEEEGMGGLGQPIVKRL